ncbi:glutaminase family protein [Fibrella aquatilis]|uniref:DUF4965 domain-containing protein n=1 Tax=Fibrella aquatilis TaxID=2817059 RepID=A0A939G837_9BACT|nr:glutaminase family protein [Fibrella aquatilis]MBO0931518.1 DUF4965 domain-containing protein [Fibrella aquatilis]
MKNSVLYLALLGSISFSQAQSLRPPAYPLITHDPYFSVWSETDKLTDSPTRHWTGKPQSLEGVVRVDGVSYQFLGAVPTTYTSILPTGETRPYTAQYTFTKPEADWQSADYVATSWQTGPGPFGDTPDARTNWRNGTGQTGQIWTRREFTYDGTADASQLLLSLNHDDDVEIYLNGVSILNKPGYVNEYILLPLSAAGQAALKKGKNVLAIHCTSPGGGSFVDVGIVVPNPPAMGLSTATQTGVRVSATQTNYTFAAGPVQLTVNFLSPLLLDELEVVARPVSYVTFTAKATDGKSHNVQLFMSEAGTIATNSPDQDVVIAAGGSGGLRWLNVGTQAQPLLKRKGDNVRIDWGYAYLAAPAQANAKLSGGSLTAMKDAFLKEGTVPTGRANTGTAGQVGLAVSIPVGSVGASGVEKHLLLAYDDLYSVQYFGQNLRPWWRRNGKTTMPMLLQTAEKDYARLTKKSTAFDAQLRADAQKAGGKEYADLCVLAYRQAIAAHKMVENPNRKGELFFFSKENFSNGSIGTVDITYPSAPMFLLYNNELAKGLLRFIFDYSETGRWKKDFPAHDVGTYPLANGQTYGEDMPVEEAGNMMIITAAVAQVDGNASFARKHWPTLTKWVSFLKRDGFDPGTQLCTDDFAGHLARNANLSAKAIMGIACYGKMAQMMGDKKIADEHMALARDLAKKWMVMDGEGDHYALTFDKTPNSWSQKYNIVWDKLLGMNVFPKEVAQKEIAFYLKNQQTYGLPLDSRKTYTKSDWIMWTATMADSNKDFQALISPVWKFANETPSRVPLTDWHETTDAKQVGFQARSVVGGYYIKMLEGKLAK